MLLRFSVVTVMPEIFDSMRYGVCGRAIDKGLVGLDLHNPRDWSKRAYRQVDDKPFGGGPGMVMMYEPLDGAIRHAQARLPEDRLCVYLSPQGRVQPQKCLKKLADERRSILFVAGRYEGIDERVIQKHVDEEWSLGDFVLSGGELAAMAYIDAITRLLPGVLGHSASAEEDSFSKDILDCPHYTRPAHIDGMGVPPVLMNGNHRDITRWRRKQALGNTWHKRPELLAGLSLNKEDEGLLQEFIDEQQ